VLTDLLWEHAMCCTANCLLMVNKVLWDYCTGAKSMNQKQPQHGKKSLTLQQCAHAVLSAFQSSKITNHSLRYDFVLQVYWLLMVKQAWRQLHYLICVCQAHASQTVADISKLYSGDMLFG